MRHVGKWEENYNRCVPIGRKNTRSRTRSPTLLTPPLFSTRYELAYKANIEWVVFTCGKHIPPSHPSSIPPSTPSTPSIHPSIHIHPHISLLTPTTGSSRGRGPRCASWFLEHVREVAGDNDMQVLVLEGGLKGWVKGGERFTGLMDGYRKEYWEEVFREEEEEKKKEGEKGQVVGV
jgi:hypothetical protein